MAAIVGKWVEEGGWSNMKGVLDAVGECRLIYSYICITILFYSEMLARVTLSLYNR